MKFRWVVLLCLSLLVVSGGCAGTSNSLNKNENFKKILTSYRDQNAQLEATKINRREQGIKNLTVTKSDNKFLISLDLMDAKLSTVVNRLLEKTDKPYRLNGVNIYGKTTARFSNFSLLKTLNLLLEPLDISCDLKDGVLSFKETPNTSKPDPSGKPRTIDREVEIGYLDFDTVKNILDGLYPLENGKREKGVYFGIQPHSNRVYLSGPEEDVKRAEKILRNADRMPPHIMIEALVVELDSNALLELGTDLESFSDGAISALSTAFGAAGGNAISFTRVDGVSNATSFTALINFLVSQNKGRFITRPYLSTLSGKKAEIDITRDRYVIIPTAQQGAAITAPKAVPAGVLMNITPFVRADGKIRMDFEVEDSQFKTIEGNPNVVLEIDKNKAKSSMMVDSGQSIIIGGLVLNQENETEAGFPWLRHIPGLNLIFEKTRREIETKEIMIFLTPTMWEPKMAPPMDEPGAMTLPLRKEKITPSDIPDL